MNLFWKKSSEKEQQQINPIDSHVSELVVKMEPDERLPEEIDLEIAESTAKLFTCGLFVSEPEVYNVESLVKILLARSMDVERSPILRALMISVPLFGIAMFFSFITSEWMWGFIFLSALLTSTIVSRQVDLYQREREVMQCSDLDNRWLGVLCEALYWPNRRARRIARKLLTRFLPTVDEGDENVFNEEQRFCLYQHLTHRAARANPELTLAILHSLPYIGTEAALPNMERLTVRSLFSPISRKVRAAAASILAPLERRVAEQRAQEAAKKTRLSLDLDSASARAESECTEEQRREMAAIAAHVDSQMQEFEVELRKLQVPGMRSFFLFASWLIIVPYTTVQAFLQYFSGNWPGGIAFTVLTLLGTQLYRLTLSGRHRLLASKLANLDDVRCIGRLAETLDWPDATVRQVVIAALMRLLPRVKASDKVLQNAHQRGNLLKMLTLAHAKSDAPLLVCILKALEQIGDTSALPYVQQLAKAVPSSAQERMVCFAARECLPFLEIRADLNWSSQTLLRASSANSTEMETLLRPATSLNITDPDELLRPVSGRG